MSPSSDQTAGTPLPAPVEGQAPVTPLPRSGSLATANPASPLTTIPLPPPTVASPANPNPPQTAAVKQAVSGFQAADDKDVIEPEWVHKAKAIVLTTSDDPYKQSEQLTVFKADYMQKRYNKTVKLK